MRNIGKEAMAQAFHYVNIYDKRDMIPPSVENVQECLDSFMSIKRNIYEFQMPNRDKLRCESCRKLMGINDFIAIVAEILIIRLNPTSLREPTFSIDHVVTFGNLQYKLFCVISTNGSGAYIDLYVFDDFDIAYERRAEILFYLLVNG
jgi:hypothetical protein